jgi:catechol 2,3-dioxygenase-like lactoylglutathione lyase family enzyme
LKLEDLDHVAIAVADPQSSAAWYTEVLGMERRYEEVWGDVPIFMCAGTSAIAVFPRRRAGREGVTLDGGSEVRHIAFRADRANFDRARAELEARGIQTEFEDHGISHSVYFDDPDGFHLEITTYDLAGRAAR